MACEFVGIGDLHLTSSLGKGGLSSYVKDHDQAVGAAVNYCLGYAKKKGVRNIFLYGDLCEGPRMSYEGQKVLLSILRSPFKFHIILGNHDKFGENSELGHSLELIKEFELPNVIIYEEPTEKIIDGSRVNFLPWPHSDFKPNALNVAHVDVAGAKTDSGQLIKKGNTDLHYAVIGHIHTNQQVRNSFFSGTLYQTNFGESSQKFFHHGRYEDGWEIENIPARSRYRLHSVEVNSKKDLHAVPRSDRDLVKLIIANPKITAADYADINVVKVMTVNNARELALAKIADLSDGAAVEISSDEFFAEWLARSSAPNDMKARAGKLRTKLLKAQRGSK